MVLAKDARIRPRDLATKIVDILKEDEMISSADIGPDLLTSNFTKNFGLN